MKKVFVVADAIFSPLGSGTEENMLALRNGRTGVKQHKNFLSSSADVCAALFSEQDLAKCIQGNNLSLFEKIIITSINECLEKSFVNITDARTILIISSTKGNISMLEQNPVPANLQREIALTSSAKKIAQWYGNPNEPIVVSNACISGLAALLVAKRLIQLGKYDHAIVSGADLISRFVQSGFESFQAISDVVCKPFDKNRNGINLGEAAATMILSKNSNPNYTEIILAGGSISNDANHISGPSRTGEELAMAIQKSFDEAELEAADIGYVSAHGTATIYNDEMEAKAFDLAGLTGVPVNSLKGFYGHTLGAAGLLESVIAINSMKENKIFATYGFENPGVSLALNVSAKSLDKEWDHTLKTASGFGGCNAALVFSKNS